MAYSEKKILESVLSVLGTQAIPNVPVGLGDDCAAMKFPSGNVLATVDRLVEGIHFDCRYFTPEEVGQKAMAVSLSDIAAMGGTPRFALVSLGVSGKEPNAWVSRLFRGVRKSSRQYGAPVVGGNVTKTAKITVDVVLLGSSGKKMALRNSAKKGDILCVTGTLGAAAAGLEVLQKWGRSAVRKYPHCTRAQLVPTPRVEVMRRLVEKSLVSSALDLSDGLYLASEILATASKVGLEIVVDRLPVHPETRRIAGASKKKGIDFIVGGGEEYEILMTVAPKNLAAVRREAKRVGVNVTPIGLVSSRGVASVAFTPPVRPRVYYA